MLADFGAMVVVALSVRSSNLRCLARKLDRSHKFENPVCATQNFSHVHRRAPAPFRHLSYGSCLSSSFLTIGHILCSRL